MDYDHSFGAVIDKGTLDALNCGEFKIVEDFVTCIRLAESGSLILLTPWMRDP